ncbi:TLD-domain-containing protein [Scheffersomyces amazonensis]|uniref:TLD-domain-containing protein n=1 Tax=Scheffersomyces amazonensis TaxID=1078765 RepID=UPI00315C8C20
MFGRSPNDYEPYSDNMHDGEIENLIDLSDSESNDMPSKKSTHHNHNHETISNPPSPASLSPSSPTQNSNPSIEKLSNKIPPQVRKRSTFFDRIIGRKSPSPTDKSIRSSRSSSVGSNYLPPLSPLSLKGYKSTTKHRLLDDELASNIRNLLPARLQLFDEWEMVYSLEQDGISLNTLYRHCDPEFQLQQLQKKKQDRGYADSIVKSMVVGRASSSYNSFEAKRPQGYVLIIQDEKNSIFGCYLNENLRIMEHKRYYGNGECFLWKCENYNPRVLSHGNREHEGKQAIRFKAFMYTGINDNIIFSNSQFISIGSSNGENGLFIDKSLYKGVSYRCETFGNEILNDQIDEKFGKFKIMGLEIWRVGTLV